MIRSGLLVKRAEPYSCHKLAATLSTAKNSPLEICTNSENGDAFRDYTYPRTIHHYPRRKPSSSDRVLALVPFCRSVVSVSVWLYTPVHQQRIHWPRSRPMHKISAAETLAAMFSTVLRYFPHGGEAAMLHFSRVYVCVCACCACVCV